MNLDQVIEGAMDELSDEYDLPIFEDIGVRFELPAAPSAPPPSICVVHGLPGFRHGQTGNEYHIHYTGKLSGRHFDEIVVRDYGFIPKCKREGLLDWLPTRLRHGGSITIKWNNSAQANAKIVTYDPASVKVLIGTATVKDGTVLTGPLTFTEKNLVVVAPEEPAKCECGSAACGSSAHSDWCPAR